MKRDVISRVKQFDIDVHNHEILSKQPLFSLHTLPGDDRQVPSEFNRQVGGVASLPGTPALLNAPPNTPIGADIRSAESLSLLKSAAMHNTPPQVGISTYRDKSRTTTKAAKKRKARTHRLLVILRSRNIPALTLLPRVLENDQRNAGDQPKPEKKKSDKNKSKPDKQGDREQQEPPKRKTKGLSSSFPLSKEQTYKT